MDEISQERRRFTRIHFDADCTLKTLSDEWKVRLVDICFKGALAETTEPLPLEKGAEAQLIIQLDEGEACIEMPVVLNHKEGSHVGFQAQNMELNSMTHLKRLVELNLGDPDLLDRELDHLFDQ
ncbi:PilZ domain-containing protein [Neptunomonas concharum]|uniref:PilZ domain-containing protein n=1 Tax=Neptunomonas concharum TaxID=1031538 RepID=UPI0023EA8D93|nr:PilZ domain-containing protein [Neptunomonas concharum]